MESKDTRTISLPDEINKLGYPTAYIDSTLYMTKTNKDSVKVTSYNIEDGKTITILDSEYPESTDEFGEAPYSLVKNNKLYIVDPFMELINGAPIFIIDLKHEKILFEGEIMLEDPVIENGTPHMYLYDLEFAK